MCGVRFVENKNWAPQLGCPFFFAIAAALFRSGGPKDVGQAPRVKSRIGRPAIRALAAVVVVPVVAAAAAAAEAGAAAVAEQQNQNDDPPPVVIQAAADTVVVTHKITSVLMIPERFTAHSMVFPKVIFVQPLPKTDAGFPPR